MSPATDGPDHGGALPVLPHIFVVVGGRLIGDGDLGGARIGPQAQIDAEDIAVLGHILHQAHEAPGGAHEERRRLFAWRQRRAFGIVKHDEIDIAGIVELSGALLAHGEHDIAGMTGGVSFVERNPADAPCFAKQPFESAGDRGIGKARQRAADRHEVPGSGDVGKSDGKRSLVAGLAQALLHGAPIAAADSDIGQFTKCRP